MDVQADILTNNPSDWCGCSARAEVFGTENWWTGAIVVGSVAVLALTKGGTVTNQTKHMLAIGLGGALVAIIANKVINPAVGA